MFDSEEHHTCFGLFCESVSVQNWNYLANICFCEIVLV